ncbi:MULTISPECIES: SpoIIIAC/SpoIIIAD family protein [Romboutsia]|uniref:Stage III sporulation protein AC/AD protein family n=1 Tax=Romboutsia hominis TaxID=1507512 RepID=A0A2P2BX01_9FIRM|nr:MULTISPECIES: SpoIIIAC/SpoIIIAD family protein [Romboutsia]MCH1960971.1 stage III sporulation protein AC [Romboutsia hominis]MCH1968594.1 stage III sporulation protein AC [Romboutsia hominis]MDB8789751.1 SpoIIIAC/SpoIIIAD family protein [Romboutsia sp. 1001216sp1]MDB8792910.1 SpoIIIAC/SpoIIIAD family protein [Romboutsia sp. 1001216sp1]MDB8795288.1 SpoIIIAC/SpoIIIAD family protein [Romboutsia sp. 1001216sp1]
MDISLIFKLGIGALLITIINTILDASGRKDWQIYVTVVGVVMAFTIVLKEVSVLFDTIKTMFMLY